MNNDPDEKLRKLLQKSLPHVKDRQLKRDLWPETLRKLDEQTFQVPWFDWVLVALVLIVCLFVPEMVPSLLYNL